MELTRITTLKDLRELLELLGRYEVSEFEVESEGHRLRITKARRSDASENYVVSATPGRPPGVQQPPENPAEPSALNPPAAAPAAGRYAGERLPPGVKVITSPMVGTFYRAPSPEADPFIEVGDRAEEDTILCIIEAMKVMNEITAGVSGVVQEILVKNGESVEFGQPLYHILTE